MVTGKAGHYNKGFQGKEDFAHLNVVSSRFKETFTCIMFDQICEFSITRPWLQLRFDINVILHLFHSEPICVFRLVLTEDFLFFELYFFRPPKVSISQNVYVLEFLEDDISHRFSKVVCAYLLSMFIFNFWKYFRIYW